MRTVQKLPVAVPAPVVPSRKVLLQIAAACEPAPVDPRTVARYFRGQPMGDLTRAAIKIAAAKLGLEGGLP